MTTVQQAINTSDLSPISKRAMEQAFDASGGASMQGDVAKIKAAIQALTAKLDVDGGVTGTDYAATIDQLL